MTGRLPAAERRQQLLDTALDAFSEHGFTQTSMNDIAEAAGVTKPVLYQHFRNSQPIAEATSQLSRKYLHIREGKTGVLSYVGFDGWWNGGLRSTPAFHNMHGILTETERSRREGAKSCLGQGDGFRRPRG